MALLQMSWKRLGFPFKITGSSTRGQGFRDSSETPYIKRLTMNNQDNIPIHSWRKQYSGISFYINRISNVDPEVLSDYPHRDHFYSIYYIEKGKGFHIVDLKSFRIKKDSFFFLSPGRIHFWKTETPIDGTVITFKGDFFPPFLSEQNLINELDFFHNIDTSPLISINGSERDSILKVIELMKDEFQQEEYGRASNLQSLLRILLIKTQRALKKDNNLKNKETGAPIVRDFRRLVQEFFLTNRSVSFYSDKLGMSKEHLYDIVKKTSGFTPGQIIRIEIIIEVKRLLAYTDLPIADIGYKLNFNDPSYFSRFFRRETGISPKSFRSQILEKHHFTLV